MQYSLQPIDGAELGAEILSCLDSILADARPWEIDADDDEEGTIE